MDTLLAYLKYSAKAISSAVTTVIACLLLILSGNQNLADVTFVQWLWVGSITLGSFGITYAIPNGSQPPSKRGEHVA